MILEEIRFFNVHPLFFHFLEGVKHELIIICPYIKLNALKELLTNIPDSVNITVVARWKLLDLLQGVSDLEIYNYLKKQGHELYINKDIHLKIIIKDKRECVLGSANITKAGLGLIKQANIEASVIHPITDSGLSEIMKVLKYSKKVDDLLFKKISNEVSDNGKLKELLQNKYKTSYSDTTIFQKEQSIVVADFPFCRSSEEFLKNYSKKRFNSPEMKHDMSLFDFKKNEKVSNVEKKLRERFISSDAFLWQESLVDDTISFGTYSAALHSDLVDDPKPYRKTVKQLVQNMYSWTQQLVPDQFQVKRPKHSQILIRVT